MPKRLTAAEKFSSQVETEQQRRRPREYDVEGDEVPMMDDFDVEADVEFGMGTKKQLQRRNKKQRLSMKGELDQSLTEGKYAAKPVVVNDVMDDIFGDLDEDIENEAGVSKFKTQEQYEEWLEETKQQRKAKRGPTFDEGDEDLLQQLDALRQRQLGVEEGDEAQQEVKFMEGAAAPDRTNDATQCAKSLFDAFHELVQVRLKMQTLVTTAVRLPQEESRAAFAKSDAETQKLFSNVHEELKQTMAHLLNCALETENAVPTESTQQMWKDATQVHNMVMHNADATVEHWGDKAIVTAVPLKKKSSTLEVINRSLADQIRGVLEGGKLRILERTRRNRQHVTVFGHAPHWNETEAAKALRIADGDIDPEVFDDADFLRELLHRSMAALSRLQSASAAVEALQDIERQLGAAERDGAQSRKGLHRLTKGKAVSTDPRPKLVGFMAPVPYPEENTERHDALLISLFK